MLIIEEGPIRQALVYREVIAAMRDALIAQSRGVCDTPMPMHLDIPNEGAEVHIKASYRRGGKYFALKMAASFPRNVARGLSAGEGVMLLCSAETGAPVVVLADHGHLTDVRTAAAAAMVAEGLGRKDSAIGIIGTGIQARLQAAMHAEVLPLAVIWLWGRTPERVDACRRDLKLLLPRAEVNVAASPADVAAEVGLIVTVTASRAPLLAREDVKPGTHISAVGSDAPGKQELDPGILQKASLILVDSVAQCERLGELQHAPDERARAINIGKFCESGAAFDRSRITVADFTGLGVEDLSIAEYCYSRIRERARTVSPTGVE